MESNQNEQEKITKGIDLAARELKEGILYLINNSGLPPVLIKYVLNDLLTDTERLEADVISMQNKEYIDQISKLKEQEDKENKGKQEAEEQEDKEKQETKEQKNNNS